MQIIIRSPTSTPRMVSGIGPCDNCKMNSDISINPHPNDCEQCRNLRIKSYPYSNTDNCRAHWACNFGKATATCFPEGFRYVPYRSCVEDLKCKDICPPTLHQEGPCDIRVIFNKLNNNMSKSKAELFISFSNDTNDYSGNNIDDVSIFENGLGYFNGESRLTVDRLSNVDLYTDLVFLQDTNASALRAMFSNCDCCDNPATMMMVSSKANLHFMAKTKVKKNNTTTDRFSAFHLPVISIDDKFKIFRKYFILCLYYFTVKYGKWNEAYYMLNTMSLEGKVNGIDLEKKTYGSIKQSQAALHIGYGRGFQNFKGYMDYVTVFLCRTKNL